MLGLLDSFAAAAGAALACGILHWAAWTHLVDGGGRLPDDGMQLAVGILVSGVFVTPSLAMAVLVVVARRRIPTRIRDLNGRAEGPRG